MESDTDRFFHGACRGEALQAVLSHARHGHWVVLEGVSGSGVSRILGQATRELIDDMEVVRVDASQAHDAGLVVNALLWHFGIERDGLPAALKETLSERRMAILVDGAQSLAPAAVHTMKTLKSKLGSQLAYVLAGEPGVAQVVASQEIAPDDLLELLPLTADDVQAFSWHVMGYELDDHAAQTVCDDADGNIRAVMAALRQQMDGANVPIVSTASDMSAVEPDDERFSFSATAEPSLPSADAVESEQDVVRFSSEDEPEAVWSSTAAEPMSYAQTPADEDDDVLSEEGEEAPVDPSEERGPLWRHGLAVVGLLAVVALFWLMLAEDKPPHTVSRAVALPAPEAEGASLPKETPAVTAESLEPEKTAPAIVDVVDDASVTQESVALPSAEKQQSDNAPVDSATRPEPEQNASSAWASVADDQWFLQVLVSESADRANAVVSDLGASGQYYQALRNGRQVFVVLHGPHASRALAIEAKATLPQALQQAGPFPRQMRDIRNEL